MTTSVVNFSNTGFVFAAAGDILYVPTGGNLYNSSGIGIFGAGYQTVYDNGDIFGTSYGISIGGSGGYSTIIVANTGHVEGNFAMGLNGAAYITNAGEISGGLGIYQNGSSNTTLYNTGIVSGNFYSYSGASGVDSVTNAGTMIGSVDLGSNNDFYDGRDTLVGGSGGDNITDYSGSNWIVGGGGDDTVTLANWDGATNIVFGGDVNGTDNSGNDTLFFQYGYGGNIFLQPITRPISHLATWWRGLRVLKTPPPQATTMQSLAR